MDKEDVIYVCACNGILFSLQNEQGPAICNNVMDLEGIMLTEISQRTKTNTIWFYLYVRSKELDKKIKTKLI